MKLNLFTVRGHSIIMPHKSPITDAGNAHLNSEGESISTADLLVLGCFEIEKNVLCSLFQASKDNETEPYYVL